MLVGIQTLLQHLKHLGQVALQHRNPIEPQAWKNLALEHTTPVLHLAKHIAAQHEPVDASFRNAPNQVLFDALSLIRAALVVQVAAGAEGGYFADPLPSALT